MFKKLLLILSLGTSLASAQNSPAPAGGAGVQATVNENGTGAVTLTAKGVLPKPPLFFRAAAASTATITSDAANQKIALTIDILQGTPERITLGIQGQGKITSVTGAGLASWSVRTDASGKNRHLDLIPTLVKGKPASKQLKLSIQTKQEIKTLPASIKPLTLTPGKAVGFSNKISVVTKGIDARANLATGLTPLEKPLTFHATGDHVLGLQITQNGASAGKIDLRNARLVGSIDDDSGCVVFRYTATAHVSEPGKINFLHGTAALNDLPADAAYRLSLSQVKNTSYYWLEFDRAGTFPVSMEIIARINDAYPGYAGWNTVSFTTPHGAVVPVTLNGLPNNLTFAKEQGLLPLPPADGIVGERRGFLPATGVCFLAWQKSRRAGEGKLAFTSKGLTDVSVAAGIMRQVNKISLKVLQGKLTSLSLRMDGAGEILDVTGTNIAGWKVEPGPDNSRILRLNLSVPLENQGLIRVLSQSALEAFPVTSSPLRLTPEGVLRHSGFVRLTNVGAVRLETANVTGMMQLSPKQFPGASMKARQTFVYRYPSSDYAWQVRADQILPEVSLHQVALYQQAESDLLIRSTIELDIREAPVREWELRIPDGYAVADLRGADVADYVVAPTAIKGMRDVKVLFKKPVIGRQLISIRLEKNSPAKAGTWQLVPLEFPGAKSLRGQIGVVASAGWRVQQGAVSGLTETPLSYFPMKDPGLQQSYRIRETKWKAGMNIIAREQSIQADVFHLYSLKEGMAYGSVLLNYFVVGAPVTEWKLSIPEAYGNVAIEGQNVRQWRRIDAEQVVVELEQPVSGAAILLVTFENSMSARGGKLSLAEVRPLNVQGESGFIEVVSPVLVNQKTIKTTPGLLKISAQELPEEFRLLTTAPALAAWQYAARPFELEIDIAWFKPGETLGQVVDFADLISTVSRDGQVMTEATFFVRSRGRQALRMTLPTGSKLWDARANNQSLTARKDGEQYLLPLPVADDPNKPVKVTVRYGGSSEDGSLVQLGAPALTAPLVIAGWKVSGGKGRLLVPTGGNSAVSGQPLTETGFESLNGRAVKLCIMAAMLVFAVFLLRGKDRQLFGVTLAAVLLVIVAVMAFGEAREIWENRRVNHRFLNLTAPVVNPESPVTVTLKNTTPIMAMITWWGVISTLTGVGLMLAAGIMKKLRSPLVVGIAAALIAAGILAQRGGGAFFLSMIAALALLMLILAIYRIITDGRKRYNDWKDEREKLQEEKDEIVALGSNKEGATQLILTTLIAGSLLFGSSNNTQAAEQNPTPVIDSITQTWDIKNDRLFAKIQIAVQAKQGLSYQLLRRPGVMTSFQGNGLRVNKVTRDGNEVWMLVAERDGYLTATASYEMVMPEQARNFTLPTGSAGVQKITATLDQPGLELFSTTAVRTRAVGNATELLLTPQANAIMGLRAKGRDLDKEETKFYAEISNLYLPSPGVIDGYHRVTIRPSSGKVSELELTVPVGFMVSEIIGNDAGNWRFDPTTRKLLVDVQPAQSKAFSIVVETQRGLAALPAEAKLSSLTVSNDAGETNMIGLAFGSEAQPGTITPTDLSVVNVDDFDRSLIPTIPNSKKIPRGILHKVYRSTAGKGSLSLQVAPVKPEVRVVSRQELTLGSERVLLSAVMDVSITRAGIFKLSFPVPAGMEVESLSGSALSHWTETEATIKGKKQRVVTMHLTGKTFGNQRFSLALTSGATGEKPSWETPRLLLNEAIRQSGQLLVVPEKGIRIRAVDRRNVSTLQVKEITNVKSQAAQQTSRDALRKKGGLAFRLLQSDWSLKLAVEKLKPWVTASVLHEVTLREGQTRTRISTIYQIEHAAVKSLQVKLPGLSEEETRTVRASGTTVQEISHLKDDTWVVSFRRGVLGSVPVHIEYQRGSNRGKGGSEKVYPANLLGTKRVLYFLALRTTGRLDMRPGKLAEGWRSSDWSAVPKQLRNPADNSVPDQCYRLNDPIGNLEVSLKRHEMAGTLKLRVTGGNMMTVFSPNGDTLTSVRLTVPVEEKDSLKVSLPKGAALYNVLVNDEPVHVVREGDNHLFHVSPPPERSEPAIVELTYSTSGGGNDLHLAAPGFNVPIERIVWDVLVPDGYRLAAHGGGFELRGSQGVQAYGVKDYLAAMRQQRSEQAAKGVESLQKANTYMRQGKRAEAAKELSKVTKNRSVDAASNEDARVQLRQLQTQQALWGLNTRKQRIYLDNKASGKTVVGNTLLEDSAFKNPLFNGKKDFDVSRVDDFLRGNSVEEKKALKGIAKRIVTQQMATEPAPQTISTIVRGRGEVLRFTRGITVDGSKAPGITLEVEKTNHTRILLSLLVLIATGVVAGVTLRKAA